MIENYNLTEKSYKILMEIGKIKELRIIYIIKED